MVRILRGSQTHDPFEGVTPYGAINTGASRARVTESFEPVLDAAVTAVQAAGGEISLYVYGSVATGTARIPRSDVDLLTIRLASPRADELSAALSAEFSQLCRSVEVGATQPGDYVGEDDEAYGNRVFLAALLRSPRRP